MSVISLFKEGFYFEMTGNRRWSHTAKLGGGELPPPRTTGWTGEHERGVSLVWIQLLTDLKVFLCFCVTQFSLCSNRSNKKTSPPSCMVYFTSCCQHSSSCLQETMLTPVCQSVRLSIKGLLHRKHHHYFLVVPLVSVWVRVVEEMRTE